jgi:hypothetical protein
MTTKWFSLLGVILLAFTGCQRSSSDAPANGFRLTVQDILAVEDMQLEQLAILSSAGGTIAIDADLSHMSVVLDGAELSKGNVTLMGSRIAPEGQPWAYMHTLIRVAANGGSAGGGPAFEARPRAALLSSFFTVTAKAGDYAFDTPVEIGTMRGKPITLTLKRAAH